MLIKTIKNNVESDWFELTKKIHRSLLEDAPDAAIVLIDDLYPNSPNSGTYVTLDFDCFTILARDFVLEENRQEKRIKRHQDKRALENISGSTLSLEEELLRKELLRNLILARQDLTPIQQRRLKRYIEDGLSMRAIAAEEGVSHTAIKGSIHDALKKIKKNLK